MPVTWRLQDGYVVSRDDGLEELRFLLCAMAHRVGEEVEDADSAQL
jgi:hypothetical protein